MQYPQRFLMSILAAALLFPAAAWAAPQVKLAIQAQKEVTITENGEQVVKRVQATEAAPGEVVIFTINYENSGDETATNVVINNPLPEGTVYVPGSATALGEVTFSIDGGKTFAPAGELAVEATNPDGTTGQRPAGPDDYTDIRWQIPEIPAGEKGEVSYQVEVQ